MKPIDYSVKMMKKYKTRCPFEIAENKNIIIRYEALPEHIKGMTVRVLRRRYILLNKSNSFVWNRFVCAHELGHHLMHPGHNYQFIKESLFVANKFEREANEFASNLLIDPKFISEGDDKSTVAYKFDVPIEAIDFIK